MSWTGFDATDREANRRLRELAEEAARAGGAVAQARFRTISGVRLKADRSEVSAADEAAQAAIIRHLRAARPADAIIAEEALDGGDEATADQPPPPPANDVLCWVIDPIDGTRNYVRGMPVYASVVAAMHGGLPRVGAIYVPQRDAMYSASETEGLFVNGRPWDPAGELAHRPDGLNPQPVVAIPSSAHGVSATLAQEWLERFVCRNLGTVAMHLALVATGGLDAMLADNPRLWDIAAGSLMVMKAGGSITSLTGAPMFPLDVSTYAGEELPTVASLGEAHERFLTA